MLIIQAMSILGKHHLYNYNFLSSRKSNERTGLLTQNSRDSDINFLGFFFFSSQHITKYSLVRLMNIKYKNKSHL